MLYVEDEENDALFMRRAFKSAGLGSALRLVEDGRSALDYLSGAGAYGDRDQYPVPAVVLLDLNLPGLTGFDVLEWIRNHPDYAATPVVVFSSSSEDEDRQKARELGANEFVEKPRSAMRFADVVRGLWEKWLATGEAADQ